MKIIGIIIGTLLAATSGSAQADPGNVKTVSAYAMTKSRDGVRTGCEIVFQVVAEDWMYKQGAPILLNGSIQLTTLKGTPYITSKIILDDIVQDGNGSYNTVPSRPANFFLVGEDDEPGVDSVLSKMDGEGEGSLLSIHALDDHAGSVMERIVKRKQLSFVFNRVGGGSDLRINVDLTATGNDHRDDSTVGNFLSCSDKFMKEELGDAKQ